MRYNDENKLKQIKAINAAINSLQQVLQELMNNHCPSSGENYQFNYAMKSLSEIDK